MDVVPMNHFLRRIAYFLDFGDPRAFEAVLQHNQNWPP
jgi:hypothetical protein